MFSDDSIRCRRDLWVFHPIYDLAATVVTDKFLTYHQKLAFVAGKPYQKIASKQVDAYDRVGDIARG